jgi:hypothetical protein
VVYVATLQLPAATTGNQIEQNTRLDRKYRTQGI